MDSQSESQSMINGEDDFHTPLDHSCSSSEEHRSAAAAIGVKAGKGDGHSTDTVAGGGDLVAEVSADIVKDSDHIGFSEPKQSPTINAGDDISGSIHASIHDKLNVSEVLSGMSIEFGVMKADESKSKTNKLSVFNEMLQLKTPNVFSGNTEPIIVESNCNENDNIETEIVKTDDIHEPVQDTMNDNLIVIDFEEDTRVEKCAKACKNGGRDSLKKKNNGSDKFKHVPEKLIDMGIGGKRKLRSAQQVMKKNLGEESRIGSSSVKNRTLVNIMESLKTAFREIKDDGSSNVDFLETAKKCGMTFPRPRWWPPGGFDH